MSPADAIRDLLLAQHLLAAVPPAPRSLQQRVYRAAVAVVPPSMGAMRAVDAARSESDEALVAAFGGGDAGAFETLVQRHLAWMVAWARQHLPQADAEDAAQEAFLALVHKAAALQLHSTLRGYLFGLLRIQVLRARRALHRRRGEPLDDDDAGAEVPSEEPSPAMRVLARRAHGEIAEAMLRVCTLREQEVLLFDLEDADDKVIATALDVTEGHVRVIRHRAITKLRKALGGESGAGPEGKHGG